MNQTSKVRRRSVQRFVAPTLGSVTLAEVGRLPEVRRANLIAQFPQFSAAFPTWHFPVAQTAGTQVAAGT